ncbi:MAG TPA: tRNA preQ1(34) S-adenosylmethionine ribosyltransferase-isomerase QueA [Casimicrobiaceae bacterium]|jgi:S-adenosylmethionine:tRNA ribosyltransferase-isomerase|nr:tRNA preQ1(34) S-adenosylmethionine ribosyltransferase-isomerase QueA [Casimicrobiaceae bacterium]
MTTRKPYRLSDFDFDLPGELIAQVPAPERSGSRLLHVTGARLVDLAFGALPELLVPGDLLVFNDTRVVRSRIVGRKPSGGRVELMLERIIATREAWMQLRASHPPRVGGRIDLPGGASATVCERDQRFFRLVFDVPTTLAAYLDQHGAVPLPPYIARAPEPADTERYQTVYARHPGAVAAPTAGLHFDQALLAALRTRKVGFAYVTLHIGAGTFLSVESDDLSQHRMHSERFSIPPATLAAIDETLSRGRAVVAVGTTSLRALEAAAAREPVDGDDEAETSLFITPGFRFRVVDRLLTNFHLPRSTLLMLVSAFAGYDAIRAAYAHAIAARYRFFSYGDAMLLERDPDAAA